MSTVPQLETLTCPGCGATPDVGCVIDLEDVMGDTGVLLGQQLLCVAHERPYWLKPKEDE